MPAGHLQMHFLLFLLFCFYGLLVSDWREFVCGPHLAVTGECSQLGETIQGTAGLHGVGDQS